ncbi:MAG: VCBS repeat-containing protein, partial [Thermoplasmata archaeon]|nr:VCBS repeat-containing protein [Thermoplasmata archaeon]
MMPKIKKITLLFPILSLIFLFGIALMIFAGGASAELDPDPYWISDMDDKSYSVAWGDYDKDGDLDLAVGNNGPNHIYENVDGNLTMEPVWESQDDADTRVTQKVMWGDINGDGWLDLVAANGAWGSGYDVVYLNNEGKISTTPDWRNDNSDQSAGMDLGDYDGDGDLDLVTSNYNGRECVYENRDGMFTTSPTWQSYLFDDGTFDAAWFDVDNDGDLDLFFGCSGTMDSTDSNANMVYINNPDLWGSQRFGQFPDWRSSDEMWTNTVQAGDIDNDGDMDIITSNCFNNYNTVAMYENTGNSLDPDYSWSIEVYWPFGCALGDVNQDGWLDIGVSSYYSVATLVMNNNGVLGDIRVWNSSDSVQSYRCDFGDMNGDGYPEFAVANYNSSDGPGNNTVYLNHVPRPWVIIDCPPEGEEVSGTVMIEGEANYSKGSVDKVEISFDNWETWHTANGTGNWTFEWDTTVFEDGNYTIAARAKAGTLYSDPAKVNVTVRNENHMPEIEITDPEEEDVLVGIYRIRGTASDEDGNDQIQQVEVRIDHGEWRDAEGTTSWSFEWDTTEEEDEDHTIFARAFDGENNSLISQVNVTVNNEEPEENHPPEIEITSIEKTDDYTLQIQWTASDQDGDTLTIDLYHDSDTDPENGKTPIAEELENTGSYDWDISGMT